MTLEEIKLKALRLIEEANEEAEDLTDDEDFASKINDVVNQIQNELCRIKKIDDYKEMEVAEGEIINYTTIADNFYQLNIIRGVEYEIIGNQIEFLEDGTAKIYYYRYPEQITVDSDDSMELEDLSIDILEIMPYGIASDLLKSDVSNSYGQIYSQRYLELKQGLDPRNTMGTITFSDGLEI